MRRQAGAACPAAANHCPRPLTCQKLRVLGLVQPVVVPAQTCAAAGAVPTSCPVSLTLTSTLRCAARRAKFSKSYSRPSSKIKFAVTEKRNLCLRASVLIWGLSNRTQLQSWPCFRQGPRPPVVPSNLHHSLNSWSIISARYWNRELNRATFLLLQLAELSCFGLYRHQDPEGWNRSSLGWYGSSLPAMRITTLQMQDQKLLKLEAKKRLTSLIGLLIIKGLV